MPLHSTSDSTSAERYDHTGPYRRCKFIKYSEPAWGEPLLRCAEFTLFRATVRKKMERAERSHHDQIGKHRSDDIYRTSAEDVPSGLTGHKNKTCHRDVPRGPGSTQPRFTAKLWEAVKWGAFNLISARLIWPQRLAETPAGFQFKLIEKPRHTLCASSMQSPDAKPPAHYAPQTHTLIHIRDAKSINHGGYHSGRLVFIHKHKEESSGGKFWLRCEWSDRRCALIHLHIRASS